MIFGKNIHGLLLHHQTGILKTTRPYIGKQTVKKYGRQSLEAKHRRGRNPES